MTEGPRFILDGKEPVPCENVADWQAFMDDLAGRTVAQDVVGEFEILTVFVGIDLEDSESPRLFETGIVDSGDPPFYRKTWKEAESAHKKNGWLCDSLKPDH